MADTLLGSASSLHRTLRCPASSLLPQFDDRSENAVAAANRGTKVHKEKEENPTTDDAGYWTKLREIKFVYHGHDGTASVLNLEGHREYGDLLETDIPGTQDVVIRGFKVGEVWDYKTGRMPSPAGNEQLLHGALCVSKTIAPHAAYFLLGIQQPREGKKPRAKDWWCDFITLEEFEDDIQHALVRAKQDREAINAGEVPDVTPGEWCRFCPAKLACPKGNA